MAVRHLQNDEAFSGEGLSCESSRERPINPETVRIKSVRLDDERVSLAWDVVWRKVQPSVNVPASPSNPGDFLNLSKCDFSELRIEIEQG